MEADLNFSGIASSNEGDLSTTYYAWLMAYQTLNAGAAIDDLKLFVGAEQKVTEQGFRDFLTSIISIPHNYSVLGASHIAVINDIILYLSIPIEGDPEPVITDFPTIEEQIAAGGGGGA